ncbi:hypothetical protein INT48_007387 [Thamnidium elegans]|uniref:Uncharacterized protein n=1 Tax=Thamnidium elegans TaxID=101142 RepID=A0A8H7VUZ2_9FUNG|nr:hypothetical protein INT48_007387 [Thamnidium elegans]
MSPLVVDLKLYCNTYVGSLLKNSLITASKRAIIIIDDELQRKKRKAEPVTFKTPSPLKDVLRPLKVAYETSKLELCKVMSLEQKSDDVHAPAALINQRFINNSEYTNLNTNGLNSFELSDDFTLDELNTKIIKISEKLIESVIQFDDHWFFITEFEIYVRNRSYIDDCAQESWWLMYPGKLEVYLVKKNEKGNSWFEISMFWDRLEFLVTGGLRGNYSDGVVTPFLGSSQTALYPLNVSTNIKTTNVLVRKEGAKTNQTTRKLRQYNKISAKQKWLFRSSKFVRKGFYTTVPLDVHSNYIKTNMASVASFLLSKIVEKEFKEDDTQHVFKLLADTSLFSLKKTDISLNLLKRDCQKLNLPASQQVIIKCFINLAEGRMDELVNDDIMALSKGTLSSFCKNEDEKKLRRNVHLL